MKEDTNTLTIEAETVPEFPTAEEGRTLALPEAGKAAAEALQEAEETGLLPYSEGLLGAIGELEGIQQIAGINRTAQHNAHFCRDWDLRFSAETWSKLRNRKYAVNSKSKGTEAERAEAWAAGCEEWQVRLETAARNLRVKLQERAKVRTRGFRPLVVHRALQQAVLACQVKPDEDANRMLVFVAPNGGGKSSGLRWLKSQHTGSFTTVEGRPSWLTSYPDALKDLARALGLEVKRNMSRGTLEHMLVEALREKRGHVLAIDEGNWFGPLTLNLLKLLLNQTPCVLVLCCTPPHFKRFTREWADDWAHVKRRLHGVFTGQGVQPQDTLSFMEGTEFEDRTRAANLITAGANRFGSYDFVVRVMAELATKKVPISMEDVTLAIDLVEALMGKGFAA